MKTAELREKAAVYGMAALTDAEFIRVMQTTKVEDLAEFAVKFAPRLTKIGRGYKRPIDIVYTSRDAYNVLYPYFEGRSTEAFMILVLNRRNQVVGIRQISEGGTCGTVVDSKVIFGVVLKDYPTATSLILAHNHPSGNTRPSTQDNELTKKIAAAAKLLDLSVMDHIIYAGEEYYSFADDGQIY